MYQKNYHLYFVGIGGIGMSGIAELFLKQGYTVSGSDKQKTDITSNLETLGAKIFYKHKKSNIKGADVVIFSSAIKNDNPEILASKESNIPIISRAEMLAELMRSKYSVAIAGAHGKTSTTSIVSDVLEEGKLNPMVVIGGKLKNINSNAVYSEGNFIVAEADESDGSFLKFSPSIAVVTNIDLEHLDYYKDLEDIKNTFLKLIDNIPFYGVTILCIDDDNVLSIIPKVNKRYITYGINAQADIQAKNIKFKGAKSEFDVYYLNEKLGKINLNLPGVHNIYNSMAAISVGLELKLPFNSIKKGVEKSQGVQRRLEIKGKKDGVVVMDDYGHHPTEIQATLKTAKDSFKKRLVVVFQPHRYTRLKALFDDFAKSFINADEILFLPVYAASETKIKGVSSKLLCEKAKQYGHRNARFFNSKKSCLKYLNENIQKDDILMTLGAGDVYKIGELFLE